MQTAAKSKSSAKVYVAVKVAFDETGRMFPRSLVWEDGHEYEIDRVVNIKPAYAARAGGQGDRYTVRIGAHERELYFEHNAEYGQQITGRWFVERKAP